MCLRSTSPPLFSHSLTLTLTLSPQVELLPRILTLGRRLLAPPLAPPRALVEAPVQALVQALVRALARLLQRPLAELLALEEVHLLQLACLLHQQKSMPLLGL